MPAVKPLFSDHYLSKRLPEESAWAENEQAESARQQLLELYHATRSGLEGAKESQTEDDFIKPALEILGWHFIVQQGRRTAGVLDIPDYVLFTSAEKRERANALRAIQKSRRNSGLWLM